MGNLPIMGELTSFDTNIKFTYEYINKRVSFLDLQVDIVEGNLKLITSLFVKPIYQHQYLLYSSCHLEHTKRFIIYSQTWKLKRFCSLEKDFKEKLSEMKEQIIDYKMENVNVHENKMKSGRNEKKGVHFVVTYDPKLKNLSKFIKEIFICYMYLFLLKFSILVNLKFHRVVILLVFVLIFCHYSIYLHQSE